MISNVVVGLVLRVGLVMGIVSEEVSLCFYGVLWRISKREENVGYIRRGRGRVVGFPFFSFSLHATSCSPRPAIEHLPPALQASSCLCCVATALRELPRQIFLRFTPLLRPGSVKGLPNLYPAEYPLCLWQKTNRLPPFSTSCPSRHPLQHVPTPGNGHVPV